jgi:WD40 repeat protein
MLLSLCIVGNDSINMAVVAGAEDGTVIIWDISSSSSNRSVQIVPHPGCVWGVSNIGTNNNNSPSTDFVTACHDGHVRVFTRVLSKMASDSTISSFQSAVSSAQASRSTGPSADEIAKLPRWEMNTLTHKVDRKVKYKYSNVMVKPLLHNGPPQSRTWIEGR